MHEQLTAQSEWATLDSSLLFAHSRLLDVLSRPVDGYPGVVWLPPACQEIKCRNLRVSAHPIEQFSWLLEPLPIAASELHWTTYHIAHSTDGTAIRYRGWVEHDACTNAFQRMNLLDQGSSTGISISGVKLKVSQY